MRLWELLLPMAVVAMAQPIVVKNTTQVEQPSSKNHPANFGVAGEIFDMSKNVLAGVALYRFGDDVYKWVRKKIGLPIRPSFDSFETRRLGPVEACDTEIEVQEYLVQFTDGQFEAYVNCFREKKVSFYCVILSPLIP